MIRKLMLLLTLSAGTITGFAQKSYNEQVLDYIEKYKTMAIEEQVRSGIPASITLAQGIFETSAGQSELCNNASNHFGIKCKNTWTGDTYTYTDDAKDECFRKYTSAKISYADHSDFLKGNKRYSSLFQISPTDYAAWAYGLKRCGYATNPQYAKKLIKFIEDYKLQEFTYAALNNNDDEILLAATKNKAMSRSTTVSTVVPGENIPTNDARFTSAKAAPDVDYDAQDEIYVDKAAPKQEERSTAAVTDYYKVTTKNGVKGFYAKRGDMLLEYAIKNKIRYAKLLEYNDLPDAPLEADMFVYLSRKPKTGKTFTHTVENGETLLQISQDEGIQMEQLLALNHLQKGQEPVPGSVLNLQATSDQVPEVYVNTPNVASNNSTTGQPRLSNDAGFVPAGKKETANRSVEINDDAAVDVIAPQEKASNTKKTPTVNIADEPAVEDEIIATKPAKKQAETKDEKKMSALDKLKAHMDQAVYTDKDFQPKATGTYKEDNRKAVASRDEEEPASVTAPAKKSGTKVAAKKTVTPKAAAKSKVKVHTVRKGETLYEIAEKYDLTVKELQKINKMTSKTIQPGKKLKVTK